MRKVGVVVPEYNELTRTNLAERLDYFSELAKNPNIDVVLVDDCSTDGSQNAIKEYVNEHNPGFRTIFRHINGQKVGAIRNGVESLSSDTEYVVLTDFDTSFLPESVDGFEGITKELYEDPELAAGAFRIVPIKSNFLSKLQKYDYLMGRCLHMILGREKRTRCVAGAGGLWKRKLLQELFPEHSGRHNGDDMELTALAQKKGYGVRYFSQIIAETTVPDNYRTLLKQRKRWEKGTLETYGKEIGFYFKQIPRIMKGKFYGATVLWEWLNFASIPFATYAASKSIATDDWRYFASYYLADLAVSGLFVLLPKNEIDNKKEAIVTLPFMPVYRAAVYYPSKIQAFMSYCGDKMKDVKILFDHLGRKSRCPDYQ